MIVNAIKNGIVLDHINAGNGIKIYKSLKLDDLDCEVVLLRNVDSNKLGKKDIIKINADINIDLDVIGYLNPDVTVNVIKEGQIIKKAHIPLPNKIENILFCKNPRCITSIEQELSHTFKLTDKENQIYRCIYCETKGIKEE